jgi:transcription initiation factor TFIIB
MTTTLTTHHKCPECGGSHIVRDETIGEYVCDKCGLVINSRIFDRGPEWRAFTPQEKQTKRRVGAPNNYSLYDKGLSTTIQINRDAYGRQLPPKVRRQMWRLRKWQIRASLHGTARRNLLHAMTELERLAEKLHLPSSIQEMAAVIYRKALGKDLIRGRCIAAIVAAALYAACRYTKIPRTLNEVAEASVRERGELARCYRLLVQTLDMQMPVDDPLDYVSKIGEKAGVSGRSQGIAMKIVREAKCKHVTIGKAPSGLAAAALYIASQFENEMVTQSELSRAANVTEVTIRNRKKELVERLGLEELGGPKLLSHNKRR